jgi:hypothetical protein
MLMLAVGSRMGTVAAVAGGRPGKIEQPRSSPEHIRPAIMSPDRFDPRTQIRLGDPARRHLTQLPSRRGGGPMR